ncbi:hypothetical protein CHARACLAT_032969 [Characodon lateralis]|uniref:Uncharacterized protein n=1 Tax=Characodon lateralis TaxID=208331 RepID=A0ABU7CX71_9TELE|nr:hypothetical protein [Characodon lateralis]
MLLVVFSHSRASFSCTCEKVDESDRENEGQANRFACVPLLHVVSELIKVLSGHSWMFCSCRRASSPDNLQPLTEHSPQHVVPSVNWAVQNTDLTDVLKHTINIVH